MDGISTIKTMVNTNYGSYYIFLLRKRSQKHTAKRIIYSIQTILISLLEQILARINIIIKS